MRLYRSVIPPTKIRRYLADHLNTNVFMYLRFQIFRDKYIKLLNQGFGMKQTWLKANVNFLDRFQFSKDFFIVPVNCSNTSLIFFLPLIRTILAYHIYSDSTEREADEILSVSYQDGRWSKPYYDCGGGNIWMLTYTVPFFGYDNGTYFFKWVTRRCFSWIKYSTILIYKYQ